MASTGTLITIGKEDNAPSYFYKGGKKPQEFMMDDGTYVYLNSTTGKNMNEHQIKQIMNKAKQSNSVDKRVERMRSKLAAKKLTA